MRGSIREHLPTRYLSTGRLSGVISGNFEAAQSTKRTPTPASRHVHSCARAHTHTHVPAHTYAHTHAHTHTHPHTPPHAQHAHTYSGMSDAAPTLDAIAHGWRGRRTQPEPESEKIAETVRAMPLCLCLSVSLRLCVSLRALRGALVVAAASSAFLVWLHQTACRERAQTGCPAGA